HYEYVRADLACKGRGNLARLTLEALRFDRNGAGAGSIYEITQQFFLLLETFGLDFASTLPSVALRHDHGLSIFGKHPCDVDALGILSLGHADGSDEGDQRGLAVVRDHEDLSEGLRVTLGFRNENQRARELPGKIVRHRSEVVAQWPLLL